MVAQFTKTPDDPFRPLSPEIAAELEQAVRAFIASDDGRADDALRQALARAGQDARERHLRPEELLLAFKEIESRAGEARGSARQVKASLRTKLIQAMLEAYYR